METPEEQIRRHVERAREREREEEQALAAEAEEHRGSITATYEIERELNLRLHALATAVDRAGGRLDIEEPGQSYTGQTGYELRWMEPEPERGLQIWLNHEEGRVEWSWNRDGEWQQRNSEDAQYFGMAGIERLVSQDLADTERWKNGRLPTW